MVIAIILIVIGAVALAVKLGLLAGSVWGWTWPILLVVLGLTWLFRRGRGWWCGSLWRRWPEERK